MAERLPTVVGADATDDLLHALDSRGRAFLAGGTGADGKFTGVSPSSIAHLLTSLSLDVVLVEADGSRQRPIKAPAAHEPVLPDGVDLVVPVAGLDALGHPLDSRIAHRPELIAAIHSAESVTPALIAAVLASRIGGLKAVPETASVRPLLNKAGGVPATDVASIVDALLTAGDPRMDRVVVADVHGREFGYARRG